MESVWINNTSNLVLPSLAVGRAQTHVAVSETLGRIDALIQRSFLWATTAAPPERPPRVNPASAQDMALNGQLTNCGQTLTQTSHLFEPLHGA